MSSIIEGHQSSCDLQFLEHLTKGLDKHFEHIFVIIYLFIFKA